MDNNYRRLLSKPVLKTCPSTSWKIIFRTAKISKAKSPFNLFNYIEKRFSDTETNMERNPLDLIGFCRFEKKILGGIESQWLFSHWCCLKSIHHFRSIRNVTSLNLFFPVGGKRLQPLPLQPWLLVSGLDFPPLNRTHVICGSLIWLRENGTYISLNWLKPLRYLVMSARNLDNFESTRQSNACILGRRAATLSIPGFDFWYS